MPPSVTDSSMTLVVSTGIGISVIAGILSGVCYVVAHGFKPKRYRKSVATPWRCSICECNFAAHPNNTSSSIFGNNFKVVYCSICKQKVCKHRCAKYDQLQRKWICLSCHPASLWSFQGIFSRFTNNRGNISSAPATRQIQSIDEAPADKMAKRPSVSTDGTNKEQDKENVRDFIERLVATMLGGNVDDACITRMYNDKQYVNLFERYHEDLCNALTDLGSALHISITNLPPLGQSPCNAHSNLKQIIGKLLKESLQISDLSQIPQHPASHLDDEQTDQTYEELLATAILNKVVSHCQYKNNVASGSSNASGSSRAKHKRSRSHRPEKEYFFAEEKLDSKYGGDFETISSASSFNEELLHSDSSLGSTKYIDRVSLTIQQQIEAEATYNSDYDEDDCNNEEEKREDDYDDLDHYRPNSSTPLDDGSNWYLQRRHLFSTNSPVPVPMLVPSPTTESKVLIGDKEIDDTSDLSDTASDFGETESTTAPSISGIKSLIVESKTIIGGKNAIGKITIEDDVSSVDSGVKADKTGESKTDIRMDDDNVEESLESQHSNIEKDAEYMERYESLPRTIEVNNNNNSKKSELLNNKKVKNLVYASEDSDEDEADYHNSFQGSYSRREKEKWNNPVEMKNNPYTKESIEKRASISSDGFGRDYYTRMASRPGGCYSKAKKNDGSWITANDDDDDEGDNDNNNDEIEADLHKAVPVVIETSDSDYNLDDDINNGQVIVTSDSDLSLVNFYDVEKSQVFRRESNEMIPVVAQEVANDQTSDEIVITTITPTVRDENGNFTILHSTPKPRPRSFQSLVADHPKVTAEKPPIAPVVRQEPKMQKAKSLFDVTMSAIENEPSEFKFMKEHPAFQRSRSTVDNNQNNKNQIKRADNTLLKKIYANPIVRSFALSHRETIPIELEKNPTKNEQDIIPPPSPKYVEMLNTATTVKKTEEPPRIIIENVSPEENLETLDSRSGSDIDISELRDAGIVSSRIGLFSKSVVNLSATTTELIPENSDEERISANVKELRKKFDALSNNNKTIIHSLTARKKRVYKPVVHQDTN